MTDEAPIVMVEVDGNLVSLDAVDGRLATMNDEEVLAFITATGLHVVTGADGKPHAFHAPRIPADARPVVYGYPKLPPYRYERP